MRIFILPLLAALTWSHDIRAAQPDACAALSDLSLEMAAETPAKITAAVSVPEASVSREEWSKYVDWSHDQGAPLTAEVKVPAHCRVSGYVAPAVRFELRLPLPAAWNGKFLLGACSGWCGQVYAEACVPGLTRGYASATTDGGHGGLSRFDGVWAFNNRQAEIDFGYRANHVVAQAGKAIVQAYYGKASRYSYIAGCSKGGHAGLMAAQRYPADFDGVIANGPVLDYQGANALRLTWIARAVLDADRRIVLDAARVPLIEAAVMKACDAIDGRRDNLIDDPRRCQFDPDSLLCAPGAVTNGCLSAKEVEALRLVYQPPHDSRGNVVYEAGTIPGSEGSWPGWLLPKDGDIRTRAFVGADQYLKFVGFDPDPGPSFDMRAFNYDTDVERLRTLSPILDAVNPDLRAFAQRGGKLIVMHGWADAAISPLMTIEYFRQMSEAMGTEAARFSRLYMMPGAYHCNGGVGPNALDALSALEAWRERGVAPGDLKISKDANTDGVIEATGIVTPFVVVSP